MSDLEGTLLMVGALSVPIGLAVFFFFYVRHVINKNAALVAEAAGAREQLEGGVADAAEVTAVVVASEPHPHEVRDREFGVYRSVDLTLEVQLEGGVRAAKGSWDVQVTALPSVAPEREVTVRMDPADPRRAVPAVTWARVSERVLIGR